MIETRQHVISRRQDNPEWGHWTLWFQDGWGFNVSYPQFERVAKESLPDRPCELRDMVATIEAVEGRWVLARLELPK